MANQEYETLLRQGVDVWNTWKKQHPNIRPDLNGADLNGTDLNGADLNGADLSEAHLFKAHLSKTNLIGAHLSGTEFYGADLSGADLSGAGLSRATLVRADLSGANLIGADLSGANLLKADLSRARVGRTFFGDLDLRQVKGLETIEHLAPSTIGTDTLLRSEGNIPEIFLRGAGLTDTFISYVRSLSSNPIEYYTCFISYSSKDQVFAEQLYANLQSKGVRCWFAPHDLRPGALIRDSIDEAIRLYDKLVLILSQHSIESTWVRFEVEAALEKETQRNALVLFPLRLDETVMTTTRAWAASLRRERHIGDFTHWKQHDSYQQGLTRLYRDLQPETKPSNKPE